MSTERAPDLVAFLRNRAEDARLAASGKGVIQVSDHLRHARLFDLAADAIDGRPSPAPGLEEAVEKQDRTLVHLLRALATGSDAKKNRHDVIFLAAADRLLLTTRGDEREGVATPSASHRGCSDSTEDGSVQ